MPTVLVIAPDTPIAMQGRMLAGDQLEVDISADATVLLKENGGRIYDLLVLSGMGVDEQQRTAEQFQQHRRWRLVPILYLVPAGRGISIPGSYRPEMDSILRGSLESPEVQRRMRAMAHEGVSAAELVVAGPYELDPIRGLLRLAELEVALTEREAEILAILLGRPNSMVTASEIIERGWGTDVDGRYLQILRRHVSNIRRKLESTPAARSVRTIRGSGYLFDIKIA